MSKKPGLLVPEAFCKVIDSQDLTLREKVILAHAFITQRQNLLTTSKYKNAFIEWDSINKLFGGKGYDELKTKGYLKNVNGSNSYVEIPETPMKKLMDNLEQAEKTNATKVDLVTWLESKVTLDDKTPTFDEATFIALFNRVKTLEQQLEKLTINPQVKAEVTKTLKPIQQEESNEVEQYEWL